MVGHPLTGARGYRFTSDRYLNETSFTNLTIYGIATPVVWRVTTGVRF